VRRTCATISIVLTLAASLLGANPVAQAAHATRIASGASPAGWPPGCDPTDDMLTTDSRHYKVKPGGEVREVVRVELQYDSRVNLHINNNDRGDYVRGRVDLGVLKAGCHYWSWTGHANGGANAPDGHYWVTINVTAVDSGRYYQTGAPLWVHRRYHPGSVTSSRSTIYPRSTTLHDVTSLGVRPPDAMVTSTMRVRNRAGKVVFTRAYGVPHTYLRVRWDGRRSGRALPAGRSFVTVSGKDADGFTGTSKPRAVIVSGKKLVTRTRAVIVQPSTSPAFIDHGGECNGCPVPPPPCGTVVASDRFAQDGAWSYRSESSCPNGGSGQASREHGYYMSGDNAPRGYGTATVALFGGPTAPGAADQGELAYGDDTTSVNVATGPDTGDHTTTGTPVSIRRLYHGGGPEVPGIVWSFTTREGASYDVAKFTVRYTFLTPQP